MQEKHVQLNYTNLPVVKGIPLQLQQLFANLLNNAIKFSEKNLVINITSLKISEKEIKDIPQLNQSCPYYCIQFSDNGIGFNPQFSKQIFTIFQRLHHSRSCAGIELALCKKIVENHRKYIISSSEINQELLFIFTCR